MAPRCTPFRYGVPQGLVLGMILFNPLMLPLGNIIRIYDINFHCFAGENQLCLSLKTIQNNRLAKF